MYQAGPMVLFGLVLTVAMPGAAHAQSSGQSIVEEALKGVKEDQEIVTGNYKAVNKELEDGKKISKGLPGGKMGTADGVEKK